jgi:hypothetical protein
MRYDDTCVYHKRNANIPPVHAVPWGTTVNQETMTTLRASHPSTIILPAPPARSTPCTVAQTSTEEPTPFQTNRTPSFSTRSREARIHCSASVNEHRDDAAPDRSGILAKATSNHASVKMRKSIGIVPLPTFVFPTTVVRTWRMDR